MDFIVTILRSFIFFFDQIIYGFIPTVYNFIEVLAKAYIFDQTDISSFANNIYAIIAVFMLFRLGFIIINAIIDPDKLTDKSGGVTKMMYRLMVALVLVVAIPWGFRLAFELQDTLLSKNVLMKIILGESPNASSAGAIIGRTSLETFITCNTNAKGNSCDPGGEDYTRLKEGFDAAFSPGDSILNFDYFWDNINTEEESASGSGDVFKLNYTLGISTLCGGFILYLLITFAFQVAVRIVKLGFLQLLAPVAVVGYVDPKGEIFKKWLKMVISTYVNLFIRLIAIYFMVYIITLLPNLTELKNFQDQPITGVTPTTLNFIKIFIICGALMFAKEAPKMISNMFGIDEGTIGGMFKNPLKSMIGGAAIGAVGGLAAGAALKGVAGASGAIRGGYNSKTRGGSFGAGAIKGAGAAAKDISFKGGLKKQASSLLASGRKAANAGATSAMGTDTKTGFGATISDKLNTAVSHMEYDAAVAATAAKENEVLAVINNNNGDEAALFNSEPFRQAYANYREQSKNVKAARGDLVTKSNNLDREKAHYSAATSNYKSNIASLKSRESEALAAVSGKSASDPDYFNARQAYNEASAAVKALEESYASAQSNFMAVQNDVNDAEKAVKDAESSLSVYQAKFDEQKKAPGNGADAARYDTYKRLKDTNDSRLPKK